MPDSRYIAKVRRRKTFWNNVTRVVIQLFVWTGAAVLYYFAFSIFFDTPVEYRLKHSTDRLRREYATLTGRYDSLNRVMENVIARDRNVFHILFEADPYDFEEENAANRWNFYEGLLSQSTIELQKQFARRLDATERAVARSGGLLRPHGSGDRQLRLPQPDTGHPADHQQAADAAHHLLRHAYQSVPEGAALASGRRLRHSRRFARLRYGRRDGQGGVAAQSAPPARRSSSTTAAGTKPSIRIWAASACDADSGCGGATSSPCRATPDCRWLRICITRYAATECASIRSTTFSWNSHPTITSG